MSARPLARFYARIQEKARDVTAPPVLIVAFGDSVTQGFTRANTLEPRAVFHHRLKEGLEAAHPLTTFSVVNAGVAMDTATDGFGRLERDVTRHQPDLVLLAFGLNDAVGLGHAVGSLVGIPAFRRALHSSIDIIRGRTESDIILLTPNFMLTTDGPHIDAESRAFVPTLLALQGEGVVAAYAEAIREVAQSSRVPVADVYRAWEELAVAGRDTNVLLANGLNHPSAEAHEMTAKLILRLIAESTRYTEEDYRKVESHVVTP